MQVTAFKCLNADVFVQDKSCNVTANVWRSVCAVSILLILPWFVSLASCVVRDASGLLNDSLSLTSSSKNCVGLACQYGWDFTECINNNTCGYGIANYYQVSAILKCMTCHYPDCFRTRGLDRCLFICRKAKVFHNSAQSLPFKNKKKISCWYLRQLESKKLHIMSTWMLHE